MGNAATKNGQNDEDGDWEQKAPGENVVINAASLHGNLMRSQNARDPMSVFEVIEVLGEGSMGSVSKVEKRASALGGSARPSYVKSQNQSSCCPFFFSPRPNGRSDPKHSQDSKFENVPSPHNSARGGGITNGGSGNGSTGGAPQHSEASSRSGSLGQNKTLRQSKKMNNPKQIVRQASSSLISYGSGKKKLQYALKSIHLDRCSTPTYIEELKNEVEILKQLDHPNIVRAIETYDYDDRLFIVLELCSGGDLYKRDPYTELAALRIVKSLLNAISYLHSKGVVHRDLKFENIMFVDTSKDADVKIIDFGLSQKFAANEHLHETVGTVYTMAPELIAGDYDEKADVWSVGVIAFMLLSSAMPFFGRNRKHVVKKIMKGDFFFTRPRWQRVSAKAKQFVRDLLQVDVESRPTADAANELPWVQQLESNEIFLEDVEEMDRIQASIESFAKYETLKKLALMVIAYKSTSEEIGFLHRMFNKFDFERDGEITLTEFKKVLKEFYTYSDEELEAMYHGIDIDGTGQVHYIEFLAATIEAHGILDEERIAEAFDRIDGDDTGYITIGDLRDFLGNDVPREKLEKIIDEADLGQDHRVDYEEFLGMWNSEDDKELEDIKQEVKARRLDRLETLESRSTSSISDDSSIDSETQEGPKHSGENCFQKQKEMSVRKGQ